MIKIEEQFKFINGFFALLLNRHATFLATFTQLAKATFGSPNRTPGGSYSTTLPSSRTNIMSVSIMVFSLCAIIKVVQENSFRKAVCIMSSVSESHEDVASSSNKTAGLVRML